MTHIKLTTLPDDFWIAINKSKVYENHYDCLLSFEFIMCDNSPHDSLVSFEGTVDLLRLQLMRDRFRDWINIIDSLSEQKDD